MMDTHKQKIISLEEAFSQLRSNQTVVTAMAAGEPQLFFENLTTYATNWQNLRVYCANPSRPYECFQKEALAGHLELIVMFLTNHVRQRHGHMVVQYYPHHLSRWVESITTTRDIDIFWGSCSIPDERGYVSLGLSACYESEILKRAKKVILEVNPYMPLTYGATTVPLAQVDYLITTDRKLPVILPAQPQEIDMQIGQLVAELVPNGSTIQLGIGGIPQAISITLEGKKDLGVHTEMFNDAMMTLFKKGVITGRQKTIWPGKMVGSFALGSNELYEFVHQNPIVEFQPSSVVNDPYRIGRNFQMISINSAVEIDLTGQCCSESIGHLELSGIGGAADTHVGAQRSPNGRGILAMHSTTPRTKESKIVFELKPGAKVSISRNDIDTVVTEYGSARLRGKSVSERVKAMISLAHPDHREQLLFSAQKTGYL